MEISHPRKYHNGKCTTCKIPEWKLHTLENDRKITRWKMTENAQLEFARMENAQPVECQNGNCTSRKMTEK